MGSIITVFRSKQNSEIQVGLAVLPKLDGINHNHCFGSGCTVAGLLFIYFDLVLKTELLDFIRKRLDWLKFIKRRVGSYRIPLGESGIT